jgi:Transcriptional regulator, AbiEi antitoxin
MPPRPKHDSVAVTELFESQGGLARYAQLVELGVPPATIRYRHRLSGPWQRALRGTYANHTRLLTFEDKVCAALLYGGPHAVITGFTGLRLRGNRAAADESRVHLLIPHYQRRTTHEFVTVTRSHRMPTPVFVRDTRSVPYERAAVDACQSTSDFNLVRAVVSELVGRGHSTLQGLADELEASQVRHSARMRRALTEAAQDIASTTTTRYFE